MAKKTAFAALRVKDAAEAMAPILCQIGIVIGALALLFMNMPAFGVMAGITLVVAGLYVVARLISFVSGRTIRSLGFSEVGLERMALA